MAIQYSAGPYSRRDFIPSTVAFMLTEIRDSLVLGGWTSSAKKSTGTISWSGGASAPPNASTITIDDKVYTFVTSLGGSDPDGYVLIGASLAAALTNLKAAINLEAGSGSLYSTNTTLHSSITATAVTGTSISLETKVGGRTAFFIRSSGGPGYTGNPLVAGGGYTMTCVETPEGYQMKLILMDEGTGMDINVVGSASTRMTIQGKSVTGSNEGYKHTMLVQANKRFYIISQPHQFFIYPIDDIGSASEVFMGGVPFVDPNNATVLTNLWWTASNNEGDSTFRKSMTPGEWKSTSWDINGSLKSDSSFGQGTPRLIPVLGANASDFGNSTDKSHRWATGCYTLGDALLLLGTTATAAPKMCGRLWDAVIITGAFTLGRVVTFDSHTWECFTDGPANSQYACLFLRIA